MEFLSKPEIIQSPAVHLYALLCDYERFGRALPPQIQDWSITENGCRFKLSGMAECSLKLIEKNPYSRVTYVIDSDKHLSVNVDFLITEKDDHCVLQIRTLANVPFFMQGIIQKFMEQMTNFALRKIKDNMNCV